MRKIFFLAVSFFGIILLSGCAAMDLRVDTMPVSNQYGKLTPRVSPDDCKWWTSRPSYSYNELAKYVVQEEAEVLSSHGTEDMICHVYKLAVENGADAIIVDDMGTTNVAGGYARVSPVVKITAIRYDGDLPSDKLKARTEIEGFRAYKWGIPHTEISGAELIKTASFYKEYKKKDDDLRIEDAKLEEISYAFIDDKLSAVGLDCKTRVNFSSILASIKTKYGDPDAATGDIHQWDINGRRIIVKYDAVKDEGNVSLFDKLFLDKIDEAKKAAASKGAGDL